MCPLHGGHLAAADRSPRGPEADDQHLPLERFRIEVRACRGRKHECRHCSRFRGRFELWRQRRLCRLDERRESPCRAADGAHEPASAACPARRVRTFDHRHLRCSLVICLPLRSRGQAPELRTTHAVTLFHDRNLYLTSTLPIRFTACDRRAWSSSKNFLNSGVSR